jgi:hypothetical protein
VTGSDRALAKLARLVKEADTLMTVELWSLARVACFIMEEEEEHGYSIEAERADFPKALPGFDQAVAELRAAVETVMEISEKGARGSNLGDLVDTAVLTALPLRPGTATSRVLQGKLTKSSANGSALKPSDAPRPCAAASPFLKRLGQDILRRDASAAAGRVARIVALEHPDDASARFAHGALEALLLVNEHLEAELHQLYAAGCPTRCRNQDFTTVHESVVPVSRRATPSVLQRSRLVVGVGLAAPSKSSGGRTVATSAVRPRSLMSSTSAPATRKTLGDFDPISDAPSAHPDHQADGGRISGGGRLVRSPVSRKE